MKIIVYTLIILFCYQACLWLTHAEPGLGRDNYEMNSITSENFRYLPSAPDVLIVGSSKTNFFDYDVLQGIPHMGYGGEGALTGLEILNKSKLLPKVILVEIGDTLQWPVEEHCVDVACSEFRIGDVLSCMQHRYQPCAVALKSFRKVYPRGVPTDFVREHLIGVQVEQNSKPLSDDRRQKVLINCERAKALMSNLRNRGASVVMFDSPVEAVVADSPYVAAVSETIHRYFTSTDFALLSNPPGNWQTRDGTHFMPESGKLYSIWLRKEIEALVAKGSPR